jgi:Raf kinase inhibitor-like YbhB/YbcL family protein
MREKIELVEFEVISPVFRDCAKIPDQYTCRGQNVNPPLNILNLPVGTKSLSLVMHDPDAVSGDFLHWLVFDISPVIESIAVNDVPVGSVQGKNGLGNNEYMGPCPPKGTGVHRYIFDFYALDKTLGLKAGASLQDVLNAQKGHVINHCLLTGIVFAEK